MSEQNNDLRKDFIQYLLTHSGSYADLLELGLVQMKIRGTQQAHQPTPHRLQHVPLNGYVILYMFGSYVDWFDVELKGYVIYISNSNE